MHCGRSGNSTGPRRAPARSSAGTLGGDRQYPRGSSQIRLFKGFKSSSATAVAAMVCAAAIGCDSSIGPTGGTESPPAALPSVPTSPTTSPAAEDDDKKVDYSRLLLRPADLSDSEDTFTEQSTTPSGPDGLPGASALYVNQDDTRAIADTIVIYPDAETAATTLRAAPAHARLDAHRRHLTAGSGRHRRHHGHRHVEGRQQGSHAAAVHRGPRVGAPGVPERARRRHHRRFRHQTSARCSRLR